MLHRERCHIDRDRCQTDREMSDREMLHRERCHIDRDSCQTDRRTDRDGCERDGPTWVSVYKRADQEIHGGEEEDEEQNQLQANDPLHPRHIDS